MNPLVLNGFANFICVDSGRLVIFNKIEKTRLEFYPHRIKYDSILLEGHTGGITFEAIRWLMAHNVSVIILHWSGTHLSTILPNEAKNAKQRIAQYQAHVNTTKRNEIASALIDEKIRLSRHLLQALSKSYSCLDEAKIIADFDKEALYANKNLLSYEGRIADVYFRHYASVIKTLYKDSNFEGRRKTKTFSYSMNASDPVNALLNYGYAILESYVRKAINTIGLDPNIGFVHHPARAREGLVYDVQELGRWLVDLSVVQLLESHKFSRTDFIITESYGMKLRPHTAKMMIEKIRINFNRKVADKYGKNKTYQTILYESINKIASFCEKENIGNSKLIFEIPLISLTQNESIEIGDKIKMMTEKERKHLGISKSGLWYQKQKLKAGKPIKLYKTTREKIVG